MTVTYAISASGNVVPPMFIFPRVNYRDHFIRGAPPGSTGLATKSGWMNADLFAEYLDHFIKHTRPSINDKVLLLMDNHESHVSLKVVDKARENGIIILTIPPHTSPLATPRQICVWTFQKSFQQSCRWMASITSRTNTYHI